MIFKKNQILIYGVYLIDLVFILIFVYLCVKVFLFSTNLKVRYGMKWWYLAPLDPASNAWILISWHLFYLKTVTFTHLITEMLSLIKTEITFLFYWYQEQFLDASFEGAYI